MRVVLVMSRDTRSRKVAVGSVEPTVGNTGSNSTLSVSTSSSPKSTLVSSELESLRASNVALEKKLEESLKAMADLTARYEKVLLDSESRSHPALSRPMALGPAPPIPPLPAPSVSRSAPSTPYSAALLNAFPQGTVPSPIRPISSVPVTATVYTAQHAKSSTPAVLNSESAPSQLGGRSMGGGTADYDLDGRRELDREREYIDSLMAHGGLSKSFGGGGSDGPALKKKAASLDKGISSLSFVESDSGSDLDSDSGSSDEGENTVLAAMKTVLKASKKKKKIEKVKTFTELSRFLLKRMRSLSTMEEMKRANSFVILISQLNRDVGFPAALAYTREFFKEDRRVTKRIARGESIPLLRVDAYDSNVYSRAVMPIVMKAVHSGSGKATPQYDGSAVTCFRCNRKGHIANACPLKDKDTGKTKAATSQAPTNAKPAATTQTPSRCSKCGGTGHTANVCPSN